MSRLSDHIDTFNAAREKDLSLEGFNSLMLSDIALSLAMITDQMTRNATRAKRGVPAIPVSWIEAEIKRLENTNQAASKIEANSIRTLLEKWRRQEGLKDGSV